MKDIYQNIKNLLPEGTVLRDCETAPLTTFHTGGTADFLASPGNASELSSLLSYLKEAEIPYFVLGRGSNVLISDSGFRGVLISLRTTMNRIEIKGNRVYAEAGAMMPEVARRAMEAGLSGLSFCSGIPGTIGGGTRMNAGAYGGELSQVIREVTLLLPDGSITKKSADEMHFGYRHSVVPELQAVVLSVEMELTPGDSEEIRMDMEELLLRRREKQPLEYPSAGSTFKRPAGYFAGALIEEAGLKGFRIGDACVSEKHAGFVVNLGTASASDIYRLTEEVIRIVRERFSVTLEREIILLGTFEA